MALFRIRVITEMPIEVTANNVLYLDIPSSEAISTSEILDLIKEYIEAAWAELAPYISDVIQTIRLVIYVVDLLDGSGTLFAEANVNSSGINVSAMTPHHVAMKVDWKVPERPRAASLYIAGIGVNNWTDSGLANTPLSLALIAFAAAIRDAFTSSNNDTGIPVYWSQQDLTAYPLSNSVLVANTVPDIMSSRKPGVGS